MLVQRFVSGNIKQENKTCYRFLWAINQCKHDKFCPKHAKAITIDRKSINICKQEKINSPLSRRETRRRRIVAGFRAGTNQPDVFELISYVCCIHIALSDARLCLTVGETRGRGRHVKRDMNIKSNGSTQIKKGKNKTK